MTKGPLAAAAVMAGLLLLPAPTYAQRQTDEENRRNEDAWRDAMNRTQVERSGWRARNAAPRTTGRPKPPSERAAEMALVETLSPGFEEARSRSSRGRGSSIP